MRDDGAMDNETDLMKLVRQKQETAQTASKTITFKRKSFAPYLANVPESDDLESLFLEFLKDRYGA